jgi:predicted transcriptional regulator
VHVQREALLLSVRPAFVARILEGKKTAELRRVRPGVQPGQDVLIYSSGPTMALLASAVVDRMDSDAPDDLWPRVRGAAGVSHAEYLAYFADTHLATAIWLRQIEAFEHPIHLSQLRERWPWFRPPQSYCFVRATLAPGRQLTGMAPRFYE